MLLLAIESSCDETAAAVLADGVILLSSVVDSQIQIHSPYGGIVPELASRRHIETIYPVVNEALKQAGISLNQLDAIAVTQGPGLVGSLLIGMSFAKALAYVRNIPCIGVDHMAGHLLSIFLGQNHPSFPYIALAASGGHSSIYLVNDPVSYELLGQTRDDAAGEAFDKVAKLLGLGYPGGPIIAETASKGAPPGVFPRIGCIGKPSRSAFELKSADAFIHLSCSSAAFDNLSPSSLYLGLFSSAITAPNPRPPIRSRKEGRSESGSNDP